ncbi:MAG: hypothetical protein IJ809_00100 [Clostridia bacterium]|nr:hypothetical protein [Clostridia bacterium]
MNKNKEVISEVIYLSLQQNVAKIDSDGIATAISNGKEKIYIFAPNRITKVITAVVK